MRKRILAPLLCALLALTGCASGVPGQKPPTGETLPPVWPGPSAPVGDSQTTRESSAILYLPDALSRLTTTVRTITATSSRTKQQACVEALLDAYNHSPERAGMSAIRLSPVSNPVETTRDLVTVNLDASARSMVPESFFPLRVAITNTLTELFGVKYVNILVDGQDVGLDLIGLLPTGVMARYPGVEISSYWRQILDQQASAGAVELQKAAALYFVSADGTSLLGEVRNIAIREWDLAAYANLLVEELSKGATQIQGALRVMPSSDYLQRNPVLLSEERIIELYFGEEIDSFLMLSGYTRGMLLSSLCYTLSSFIPRFGGLIAYVNGEKVTEVELMDGSRWQSASGLMTRESIAPLAADTCTVYFPLADGSGLRAAIRPIAQRHRTQPRALMRELMKEPNDPTLSRALPEGVSDADILGLQIVGDTALVDLSETFRAACQGMGQAEERNMVYAMVNTLTEMDGVTRVRFYVNGEPSPLAGWLFMEGEFLRHPGLIRE